MQSAGEVSGSDSSIGMIHAGIRCAGSVVRDPLCGIRCAGSGAGCGVHLRDQNSEELVEVSDPAPIA